MAQTEKISATEVKQMIKEEYSRKLKEVQLTSRLKAINEEIAKLEECGMEEESIEEVKAGEQTSVRSTAWTGEKGGDKKWKPEFEKKMAGGRVAALKEDGSPEAEISIEEPAIEEPIEGGAEVEVSEEVIDKVIAGLKDVLEQPETVEAVKDAVEGKPEGEEIPDEEIPSEEKPEEIVAAGEEIPEEEPIDEKVIKEQDGISVAQGVEAKDAVPFDNGKTEIPKTKLNEELDRMAVLSGLKKSPLYD